MFEIELMEGNEAASEARDLLLHVAEVCTSEQLRLLCNILGEGGPAYNLQAINKLLAKRGKLDETRRIGALFKDYPHGFADPVVRAAFLMGVEEVVNSEGQLDASKVKRILERYEVPETPDLRDELQRLRNGEGQSSSWSVTDILTVVFGSASVATIAKKVPWARLARMLLLRR